MIIVDDNSTDGSQEVLSELATTYDNLVVSIREGRPSIARAWFEGFDLASKRNIVCIDGDLCHDPNYFPAMLAQLESHDLVIGSRYMDRSMMMKDKSWLASYVSFLGKSRPGWPRGFAKPIPHTAFGCSSAASFKT